METEQYEVADLYEARAAESVDQHYKMGTFEDEDYARDTAEALNHRPIQAGATYYVVIRVEERPVETVDA